MTILFQKQNKLKVKSCGHVTAHGTLRLVGWLVGYFLFLPLHSFSFQG